MQKHDFALGGMLSHSIAKELLPAEGISPLEKDYAVLPDMHAEVDGLGIHFEQAPEWWDD